MNPQSPSPRVPLHPDRVRAAQLAAKEAVDRAKQLLLKKPSLTALIKQEAFSSLPTRRRLDLNPKTEQSSSSTTPEIEWWDALLPAELDAFIPVTFQTTAAVLAETQGYLTPAERAKLKKLQKRQKLEELQAKIRSGELPVPPNRTKLKNLARVLGTAADPTHAELSLSLPRPGESEKGKAITKPKTAQPQKEAATINVYVVDQEEVTERQRYKITKNAKQWKLAGIAVKVKDRKLLVVVQGMKKELRKFSALMFRRIQWQGEHEGKAEEEDDEGDAEEMKQDAAAVRQVWTGPVTEPRQFVKFRWVEAASEAEARRAAGKFWNFSESK